MGQYAFESRDFLGGRSSNAAHSLQQEVSPTVFIYCNTLSERRCFLGNTRVHPSTTVPIEAIECIRERSQWAYL